MALQHAKESKILELLKKLDDNDRRTQAIDLSGSTVFREKSVKLCASLADALQRNSRLTALNLSNCSIGDGSAKQLANVLRDNATIFDLNLSYNKLGRPGLTAIGSALATNVGLKSISLANHRVDSSVAQCFVQMFYTNVTLLTLTWDVNLPAFNLKLTEMINRNNEINRYVVEGKDYVPLLPIEMRENPPELVERIPPELGDEEFGMELGGAGTVLWCSIAGRWELGTLKGTQKSKLVVTVEGTDHLVESKDVTRFEASHAQDLPNMVQMHNLHEAPLLYLLQRRLKNGSIYTWAGDVLISLNPYAPLPELYNMSRWQTDQLEGTMGAANRRSDAPAPPHVYAIARRAYAQLRSTMELSDAERAAAAATGVFADQSVLISGESGAGKTEASKRVIEYLTSASRLAKEARSYSMGGSGGGSAAPDGAAAAPPTDGSASLSKLRTPANTPVKRSAQRQGGFTPSVSSAHEPGAPVAIESLLKEASPILEAFGNAKTIRNDNSSRFGKYVAVQYDSHGCIAGASTETYLLERSRVVDISEGERNYHIFYQMLTDSAICEKWGLPPAEGLEALSVGGVTARLVGVSDAKELAAVKRALPAFGVGLDDQAAVWRILASVLLLRNIRFEKAPDAGGGSDDCAQVADESALTRVTAALGCETEPLRYALLRKKISVAGELIEQRYSTKAAQVCRDALAKSIFAALFDWIVAQVNGTSRAKTESSTIGILDIFGFEQLKHNSFEQLLINFVNEMLQEQFNESVFAAERRLFAAEGVEVEDGSLQSSGDRLRLMTRLLQGLDDQCRLGERGSDEEFFQEIGIKHTVRGICQPEQRGFFSINHYAGKVFYSTEGFVHKNSDQLPADVTALFSTCDGLALVRSILLGGVADPAAGSRRRSASLASSTSERSSIGPSPTSLHLTAAVTAPLPVPAPSPAATKLGGAPAGFKLNLGLANARIAAMQQEEASRVANFPPSHRRTNSEAPAMTPRTSRRGSTKSTTLSERLRAGIGQVSGTGGRSNEGLMATLQVIHRASPLACSAISRRIACIHEAAVRFAIISTSSPDIDCGPAAEPARARLQVTSLHYIRCVKPNDGMAPFGFEQARVLRQLQYSGVLEMVRIRRSGFPSRMPFAEFEAKYGILLFQDAFSEASVRGKEAGDLTAASRTASMRRGGGTATAKPSSALRRNPIKMMVKKAGLGSSAKSESSQAEAELEAEIAAGRGDCLFILRRANLFEHRHYQFGRTLVFLRNGVEATLNNAVASQMKCVLWFQKTARGRVARAALRVRMEAMGREKLAEEAQAQQRAAAVPTIQAAFRARAARREVVAARRAEAERMAPLLHIAHGLIIARTLLARREAWLTPRRSARQQCQRVARGFLGRRYAKRVLYLSQRPLPLQMLRRALRRGMLALLSLTLMREGSARRKLQALARRRTAAIVASRRRSALAQLQRSMRGARGRARARQRKTSIDGLRAAIENVLRRGRMRSELAQACDALFTAVFEDDEDATSRLLAHNSNLLLVRQNVTGQRASLAHAAAAGGATRVAASLYLQMYRAALRDSAAPSGVQVEEEHSGQASPGNDPMGELREAIAFGVQLRDGYGRTPLHYAARAAKLSFVQWVVRLLSLRPPGDLGAADLFDVRPDVGADVLHAEEAELRRGVLTVCMPGGSSLTRVLVVLGQTSLKVYALPPKTAHFLRIQPPAGVFATSESTGMSPSAPISPGGPGSPGAPLSPGALASSPQAPEIPAGAVPILSLQCDKLLYQQSLSRNKRDVIEVVILSRPGRKLNQLSIAFEQPAANADVLELHMPNAAEARAWMAALHSPRYLLSRGMHLASAVAGREAAPEQLDLWERWALVNHRDTRGESMLHAAIRGMEPAEDDERMRLMAWLVDSGSLVLPHSTEASERAESIHGEPVPPLNPRCSSARFTQAPRRSWLRQASIFDADGSIVDTISDVPSAFELLTRLACRAAHDPAYDRVSASSVSLLASHAATQIGWPTVAEHIEEVLEESSGHLASAGSRCTLAALRTAAKSVSATAELPAERRMFAPPPPTPDSQNRSLVMLSLTRLDCLTIDPSEARLAVTMLHEPTYANACLQRRAAAVGAIEASCAAASSGQEPTNTTNDVTDAVSGDGKASADRGVCKLASLITEQWTGSPISTEASGVLWWFRTWSAAYLPGEEGAVLLIKLLRIGKDQLPSAGAANSVSFSSYDASAQAVIGWVALPLEEVGEHHLQIRAPPLPLSLSEARAPKSTPINAWLHCELSLGVTGSFAAFAARHKELANTTIRGGGDRISVMDESAHGTLERRDSVQFVPIVVPAPTQRRNSTSSAESSTKPNSGSLLTGMAASTSDASSTEDSPTRPERREIVATSRTSATPQSEAGSPSAVVAKSKSLLSSARFGRLSRSSRTSSADEIGSDSHPIKPQRRGSAQSTDRSATTSEGPIHAISLLGEPLHVPPPPPRSPPPPLSPRIPPQRTPQMLSRGASSFLSPRLTPCPSALSEAEKRAAIQLLEDLPEAPFDLVPMISMAPSNGRESQGISQKRERVIELVKAAAAATKSGEHELAARGYLHAFALCGSTSLLISVANMFIRLGIEDAAMRIFTHLSHTPSLLSADQHSLVLLRLEQLKAGEVPPTLRSTASSFSGNPPPMLRSMTSSLPAIASPHPAANTGLPTRCAETDAFAAEGVNPVGRA